MSPRHVSGGLVRLPPPRPGDAVFETHVAIDPADPRRAAVVAMYPVVRGPLIARSIWCWRTTDSGLTWSGGRIVQAKFDGEGAADPQIGYGPDGALVAVAMTLPKAHVDARNAEQFTRLTSRGLQRLGEAMESTESSLPRPEKHGLPLADMICIARSEDHGQTWSSAIIPNSASAAKTVLAIDHHVNSPYRGNVYVAWTDIVNHQLAFARSVDGGATCEGAIRIGGRDGMANAQIAVGSDGTVHLLWSVWLWRKPDPDDPQTATGIFYARSNDGGSTFSEPLVIAENGGFDRMGIVSLAAASSGALLAAWSEADTLAQEPGEQVRNTIRWMHSRDGLHWSDPAPLSELAPDCSQGLPAVAATDRAWHVLSYEAAATRTTVRIHTASHDTLEFRPTRQLASREFGSNDIYLHGNYQLRHAHDIAVVGDYVGLAGAGSHLAAAIVLPEDDNWRGKLAGYAAILTEED